MFRDSAVFGRIRQWAAMDCGLGRWEAMGRRREVWVVLGLITT